MRISTVSLVLLLVPVTGCDEDDVDDGSRESHCDTCNLDQWMPALAAEGATDCGRVRLGDDVSNAQECVATALGSGAPFMVRQQLQGIDSQVELGFVVDHDGVVQALTHDSNVCGAAMCDDRCGPVVWAQECANPRLGATPEQALVDCETGESAALCEPPQ